ncbi:MAG TPA: hypothetical protein VER76_15290, partial [Pyrinomonadaceae bacterium]|nr:hypothetical protein [Pyrinomonadaceae bacterium]
MSLKILLALIDNTDPGAAGWLVLAVWFIFFVLVLNTIIFILRRLFRRWRGSSSGSKAGVRHGDEQA